MVPVLTMELNENWLLNAFFDGNTTNPMDGINLNVVDSEGCSIPSLTVTSMIDNLGIGLLEN